MLLALLFIGMLVSSSWAWHHLWKGSERREKLKLTETVAPYLLSQAQSYNMGAMYFDPWQGLALAEMLRSWGINCVEVPQMHAIRGTHYTALYEMVSNKELVLYDDPDIRMASLGGVFERVGQRHDIFGQSGRDVQD